MTLDHRYTVDTPENITFDYELAGIGTRFLAATLDSTLIILLQGLLWVGLGLLAGLLEGIVSVPPSIIVAIGSILGFALLWGYYLYFELVWNGQSPGKRLLRLRVVQAGGRPITFNAAAIRNLVRVIDFLPLFYGVGVLTMFVDGQARRLGDLAAGALVVKEAQPISLQMLLQPPTPAPLPAPPPIPPQFAHVPLLAQIQAVQPEDYALVQTFLHRRRQLSQPSRTELAAQLATTLSARLQLAVQPQHYEKFLERVELDYRRKHMQHEA